MELMSKETIIKCKYDTEEEREKHVKEMEKKGFEVSGRSRFTYDSIWCDNPTYFIYGEFYKVEK